MKFLKGKAKASPVVDNEMVPVEVAPAPQIDLLPKAAPAAPAKAGPKKASLGGFMSNFMGGGADAADEVGMLDNQPGGGAPADNGARPSTQKDQSVHNQDLWLLNLFFKGCALLV